MTTREMVNGSFCGIAVFIMTGMMGPTPVARGQDTPPTRPPAERTPADLDSTLVELRVRAELLDMELWVEKEQIKRLMMAIEETEIAEVLGSSEHPVLGKDKEQRTHAKELLIVHEHRYLEKSREAARLKREIRTLEADQAASERRSTLTEPSRVAELARRLDDVIESINSGTSDSPRPETPKDDLARPDTAPKAKERSRTSEVLRAVEALIKSFESETPKEAR